MDSKKKEKKNPHYIADMAIVRCAIDVRDFLAWVKGAQITRYCTSAAAV